MNNLETYLICPQFLVLGMLQVNKSLWKGVYYSISYYKPLF